MTNQSPFRGGRMPGAMPSIPVGEAVATYPTYQDAQQAVDVLAHADFPVEQVAIVGSDLKSVERVTGKLSWGRVAVAGAASGAWLGVFFGVLLIIFTPAVGLRFVIAAILVGAAFGMLFGLVSYSINRRQRDYTSVMQVVASSYSVIVGAELANRARNTLGGGGVPAGAPNGGFFPAQTPEDASAHPSDPPRGQFVPPAPARPEQLPPARYGERVSPQQPPAPNQAPTDAPDADDRDGQPRG